MYFELSIKSAEQDIAIVYLSLISQQTFTRSNTTIETLEKDAKYVQS